VEGQAAGSGLLVGLDAWPTAQRHLAALLCWLVCVWLQIL
jgi:hypothetical protein